MRKFYIFAALISSLLAYRAVTAQDIPPEEPFQKELTEFNLRLADAQNGIRTYSGSQDGMRINFSVQDTKVIKLNFMLDKADFNSQKGKIIGLAVRLISDKISDMSQALDILSQKTGQLNKDKEHDCFKIGELAFSVTATNGMIYIEVKP